MGRSGIRLPRPTALGCVAALAVVTAATVTGAGSASAEVTAEAELRTFGNTILARVWNVRSTTEPPALCVLTVRNTDDQVIIEQPMEIFDGGLGIWWTTLPNEKLHLAGEYTRRVDVRTTVECSDEEGTLVLADGILALPTGELAGNPSRYSELFGAF